jgi:Na+/proline symporter
MDGGIIASIILGICFWGIVVIIRSISEHKLLRKLIEKNESEINLRDFKWPYKPDHLYNLKWGLIILLAGAGLIIIHFLDLDSDSPLPYGIETISIALGFILYFFIEKFSGIKSKNKDYERNY